MKEEAGKNFPHRASERLTSWVGSPASIVIHTLFFIGIFALSWTGISLEQILLILTTAVSLEAIYLAIFIQMTVNRHTASLHEVEEEIEDLGEDLEELGEEVEDISEDIEDISEDIDKIQEEVQEEEEEEKEEEKRERENRASLDNIETTLQKLLGDIEALKRSRDS